MSEEKKKKANGDAATEAPSTLPTNFRKLDIDLPTFKAEPWLKRREGTMIEDYTGEPVRGFLVGSAVFTMQQIDEGSGEVTERDVLAYVLKLTKDCPHGFDRSAPETARTVKVGEKIRVIQTSILGQALPEGICNHPTHMLEVEIRPISKVPHPKIKSRKLWNYEVYTADKPVLRQGEEVNAVAAMLASAEAAAKAALPAAGA